MISRLQEVCKRNQKKLEDLAETYEIQREETRKIIEGAQKAEEIARKNYERQEHKVARLSSHYARFHRLMEYSDVENRQRIRTSDWLGEYNAVEQDPMYKRLDLVQCLITDKECKKHHPSWDADGGVRKLKRSFKNRTLSENEYKSLEEATHPVLGDLLKKAIRYEKAPSVFKPLWQFFVFPNYITWKEDGYPSLIQGL